MKINDDQLMLLEQLTYMDKNIGNAAGLGKEYMTIEYSCEHNDTVEEFLSQFSEKSLDELQTKGTITDKQNESTYYQGKEWAAVIRALKSDDTLKNLKISDVVMHSSSGKTAQICFTSDDDPGQAVVAFRGTLDGREWYNNVAGMNDSDTPVQKDALDYIEKLPYDDIITVGHSNGANKAMYTAIRSDKVTRCVGMDGQGYSPEFLEKYGDRILEKGDTITCYSLDNDFVHILLYPVPGAKQKYFKGYGMESGAENHSANSFFEVEWVDGDAVLKYDGDRLHMNEVDKEYDSMEYLHGFTDFVLNVMPDSDKKAVVPYIGTFVQVLMANETVLYKGELYSKDNLSEFIVSDPEALSTVAAYAIKYIDVYGLDMSTVYDLLDAFGLKKFAIANEAARTSIPLVNYLEMWLPNAAFKNITDLKEDSIMPKAFKLLVSRMISEDIDFDVVELWRMTEKKYASIGDVDEDSANRNWTVGSGSSGGETRDFSQERYELLMSTIDSIEELTLERVSSWSGYSEEEWYESLKVDMAIEGINEYIDRLSDISSECKRRITEVFNNEWEIDRIYAEKIDRLAEELDESIEGFGMLAEKLSV